jgi:hypothetical protein
MAMIGIGYFVWKSRSLRLLNRAIVKGDAIVIENSSHKNHSSNLLGKNPLETALVSENKVAFSALLAGGADPHGTDVSGLPMIHRACKEKDTFWLQEILRHGGDPNLLWPGNWTDRPRRPMYVAIWSKQFHLVPVLVDAGASLTEPVLTKTKDDYSPIGCAGGVGPEGVETVLYLLEKGAMPDTTKVSSMIAGIKQDGPDAPWRRPITKWFEDHGMDLRNVKWDGKEWTIPPYRSEKTGR